VLGSTPGQLDLWVDPPARQRFRDEVAANEHVRNFEACLARSDGRRLDCLISAERVTIADQTCLLSVILDITERKSSERDLMAAIEAVMADTTWFSRGVIEKLAALRSPGRAAAEDSGTLSPRERQVLGLMCQGLSDAAIGKRLSLSPNTARNHVAALYRKLGLHRRSDAVIWGRERGF
jgi:DNA-binding NarL/FixJ family response regulator